MRQFNPTLPSQQQLTLLTPSAWACHEAESAKPQSFGAQSVLAYLALLLALPTHSLTSVWKVPKHEGGQGDNEHRRYRDADHNKPALHNLSRKKGGCKAGGWAESER